MKEKYTQFAGVGLAVVALFVSVVALMQVDNNAPSVAEQPQARGTTYFGNLSASGTMNADGATTLNSTLDVDGNISSGTSAITMTDNVVIDGQADAIQLLVQGNGTQTNDLLVCEQSDGTDKFTLNNYGQALFAAEADADAANYDYMVAIEYAMTGITTKDRNYGLYIEGTRAAGQEIGVGDHDEAGLKIRVDTEAVTTTAGTVLRGYDVEAKADNPGGTVTNLFGGLVTAKSDTSAGDVGVMVALSANSQNNAAVNDYLAAGDFRIMRQAATEPTEEYGIEVRSSSTTGTGGDAAVFINSDYAGSATTDSWDYGVDMASAAVNTADIRLSNGETIANTTDTAIQLGGFVAFTEGATQDLGAGFTITPTASYQPITNSTGGSVTSDATTAIADGAVAGALLVICNEDAQDMVIKDGANTLIGGDITLTGGAQDCLTLLWNGADWVGLSVHDN